jgi:hypothetical protein
MMVYPTGTFELKGLERMAEDEYADALMNYWSAVKDAEEAIAPFFDGVQPLSADQLEVIASVVAHVAAAEEVYIAALEASGAEAPKAVHRRFQS